MYGVDSPVAGTLGQARKCVADHLPPFGPRAMAEATNRSDIVLGAPHPYKFATESISVGRGFTADRAPPYENASTARINGGPLRRIFIDSHLRRRAEKGESFESYPGD